MPHKELFEIHTIIPKEAQAEFKSKRVRAMVLNVMKFQGKRIQNDLRLTTEFWIHKPDFAYEIRYRGGDPRLTMGMVGTNIANRFWMMVNQGTHVRYVRFDPLYRAKTQVPGNFGNNIRGFPDPSNGAEIGPDGAFHTKIVGRSRTALPGIRPRNWSSQLVDMYKQLFKEEIDDAIQRGMQPK